MALTFNRANGGLIGNYENAVNFYRVLKDDMTL